MTTNQQYGVTYFAVGTAMIAFYGFTWYRRQPLTLMLVMGILCLGMGVLRDFARARP